MENLAQDKIFELIKNHPNNKKKFLYNRPPCPDCYVKFMGSNDGGLFLAQVLYWSAEGRTKRKDGYFFKSDAEWYQELQIGEHRARKFREFVGKRGICDLKLARAKGSMTWHYKLNVERLQELLGEFLDTYDFPVGNDDAQPDDSYGESILDAEIVTEESTADVEADDLFPAKNDEWEWLRGICRQYAETDEQRHLERRAAGMLRWAVEQKSCDMYRLRVAAESLIDKGIAPLPTEIYRHICGRAFDCQKTGSEV